MDPALKSRDLDTPREPHGLVSALQSVTDGVVDLARGHLELARAEARRDVKVYGLDLLRGVGGAAVLLFGFAMVNLAVVCVAGYFGGLVAMAVTAGALGIAYLATGAHTTFAAMKRMKERDALSVTTTEIKRSTKWAIESKESS